LLHRSNISQTEGCCMPSQKASPPSDFSKIFTSFPLSGFPVDQLSVAQRRNFETASAVIQLAVDSWQTVFRRQMDVLTQSATEGSTGLKELLSPGAPQEKLAQHADFFKSSFEKGLSNLREVSDILVKSSSEATDLVAKSVSESLAEFTAALPKTAAETGRALVVA
jgi:phasin family protein